VQNLKFELIGSVDILIPWWVDTKTILLLLGRLFTKSYDISSFNLISQD